MSVSSPVSVVARSVTATIADVINSALALVSTLVARGGVVFEHALVVVAREASSSWSSSSRLPEKGGRNTVEDAVVF